jgi:acetyl-CoA/propionyl-CoA carboxylase carboxyl transferase subunit
MTILVDETRTISDASRVDPRDPTSRLSLLLDGDFSDGRDSAVSVLPGDSCGVVAVRGRIGGAPVVAYCTDVTKAGGSLGAAEADRIIDAIELAARQRVPVIGLWHSGGAKLNEGVESMDAVGRMFAAMTRASGKVAQISVVLGPAAGAAAYGPALTDIVIMSSAGRIFVTGPDVVRSVTGEQIDMDGLGGCDTHGRRSGVAHLIADTDADACRRARELTTLFTRPGRFDVCSVIEDQPSPELLPGCTRRAYDVRPLVKSILDAGGCGFLELQAKWASNMVIGLGRLAGRTVGVLANNPLRRGGCLDSLSAEKAARFVRMCDSFGVPLLVLVDVPGYLPGVGQEWDGVVRRGAKLLHAFAEATVPRVTLITRKSYGGAYIAMNSRSLGATAVLAWPDAEVAVMGAEAAVSILHRRRLAMAAEEEREALRVRLVDEQRRTAGGVDRAMSLGVVDAVITPGETRRKVAEALAAAPAGRGHHGNIPL